MRGAVLLALLLGGCAANASPAAWQPPIGPNPVFDQAPEAVTDRRLIVTDLRLGPDAVGAAHYHPWEEFLYVIGGSTVISREGQPDLTLTAGQSIRIAPGTVHWGRAGDQGLRAVASWVKLDGRPLREAVPE